MPLRVSVVIPAYNAARFLPDAIASLRAQTRPVDQIIVVDDGSRDDTAQVVAGLGEGVTYVRQENAGVSAARNRGIAEATGDIIAFLDADDRWLPDKVAKQLPVFELNPNVGLVASDRRDVDANGHVLVDSLFRKRGLLDEFVHLDGAPLPQALGRLVQTNFLPTSSVMVRKSAFDRVGCFEPSLRYGEDLDLWARIVAQHDLVCLPDVLVLYRIHDTNAIHRTGELLADIVRVMQRIREWGGSILRQQGRDPDSLVARALWELGYWRFCHGEQIAAKQIFLSSFRERRDLHVLAFAILCTLPAWVIAAMRRIKHLMAG